LTIADLGLLIGLRDCSVTDDPPSAILNPFNPDPQSSILNPQSLARRASEIRAYLLPAALVPPPNQ